MQVNFWGLGPEAFKVLARVVARSPKVLAVRMPGNDVGDEGAAALAEAIRTSTSIDFVDAGSNGITDAGAETLASALAATPHFVGLTLDGNIWTDTGGEAIYKALEANVNIKRYFHNHTLYSSEFRQRLRDMWVSTRNPKTLANGHPDGLGGLAP